MAIKELQTRIALKYDSYAAWTTAPGKDLVLLAGEIGICNIDAAEQGSNVVPTVLFKVGDGKKTFENLPWASAKAADVYGWAKATDVVLDGKTIKFVGAKNTDGTDKVITLNYVTDSEVKAITDPIAKNVSDNASAIAAVKGRVDTLTGTGDGSITKTVAAAVTEVKAYADTAESDAVTAAKAYTDAREIEINKYADQAEADAKSYTDGKVATLNSKDSELETAIGNEATARTNADNAINAKIGGSFTSTNTVAKAITDAQANAEANAATTAQGKVDALANGQVKTNTDNIAENAAAISAMDTAYKKAVKDEEDARKAADEDLAERLASVETFFKVNEDETLDTALDTLKEIQEYLNGEGTATDGILGRVSAAEKDIDDLEKEFADGGRVKVAEAAISSNAAAIDAVEGRADSLEAIVAGYTTANTVKKAVDAVSGRAEKGITDAATAQAAAEAAQTAADTAQDEVDALELVVAGVKTTADNAKADLAALTGASGRIATAEGKITALEGIVSTGANANSKLRTDITALQTLTGTDGTIQTAIRTAQAAAEAAQSTANTANTQANTNKAAIADIQEKYLKIEDFVGDAYVFNCGSSTKVTHVIPAN